MQSQIIEIKNLDKTYGYGRSELKVLREISIQINEGEILSIIGPSGAGKSTLLNMMGCLDGFQSGSVSIMGRDISNLSIEELSEFRNRHIGFIFQLHNLLNEFTALENVMMPLLIKRISRRNAKEKAIEIIGQFGLLDRINHKPSELSGGECQRISVARALAGDPAIILADEPTGNLDSINSEQLIEILLKLVKERNKTIIIVTHDRSLAEKTARTITLVDGKVFSDIRNSK